MTTSSHPIKDDDIVDRLLFQPETATFECKRIGKVDHLLESVVAFANCEGGLLALGLEDPDKSIGRDRVHGIQSHPMNWDELQRKLRSRITEPERLPISHKEIGCTNLVRKPVTVGGPLIRQITDAKQAVINELAEKVQYGPFGFEIVQRYPVRVIAEAVTNAVIHRDYRLIADVMIRIYSDRIEIESPGLLPGTVTVANIQTVRHNRNPLIVQHLREFPDPPNLDAHEGVKMMFGTMHEAGLYPPQFVTQPALQREAVVVRFGNLNQPSAWDQVSHLLDQQGSISNVDVRRILETNDPVRASRQLKEWVDWGMLSVADPHAAKKLRRYKKPDDGPTNLDF